MHLKVRFNFFFIIFLVFSQGLIAQVRTYSNEFMSLGVGGRALAMGKAQVASVNDITSGYWNPAGLSRIDANIQISLMHSEYFQGIANYDYGSFGINLGDNSNLGISMIRFGIDNIPNTLNLIDEDGSIHYERVTGFSAVDYGFLFSYSRHLKEPGLRLGGNAKIIHRLAGSFAQAWGFGFDLGAQYRKGNFNFGLMARDITSTFNAWSFSFTPKEKAVLSATGNIIPESSVEITAPQVLTGANYRWDISHGIYLNTELDLLFTFDGKRNTLITGDPVSIEPRWGIEVGFWDIVFIRGGLNNWQTENQVTATRNKTLTTFQPNVGAGIKFKVFKLDYAFTDIGDQSMGLYSHVISLRFDIKKDMLEGEE